MPTIASARPTLAGFGFRLGRFAAFTLRSRTGFVAIVCAAFVVSLVGIRLTLTAGQMSPAWNWLDPVITLTTLAVALVVWLAETRREWESQLPKRLTVYFVWDGFVVLQCDRAYLADVGEIRSWGQQLGRQMNGNAELRFEPFIAQVERRIARDTAGGAYKPYEVQFTLTARPDVLDQAEPGFQPNPGVHWAEDPDRPGRKRATWHSSLRWTGFPAEA